MDTNPAGMPADLQLLVRHGIEQATANFWEVLRYSSPGESQWCRMSMYRLSDALENLNFLVGATALYMRQTQDMTWEKLTRYLQTDEEALRRLMTPGAKAYVAGLLGQPDADPREGSTMHAMGERLAEGAGFREPEREHALEVALAAIYTNHTEDPGALDYLPEDLQDKARRIIAILAEDPVPA